MRSSRIKWSGVGVISRFAILPLAILAFVSVARGGDPLDQPPRGQARAGQTAVGDAPLPDMEPLPESQSVPNEEPVAGAEHAPDAKPSPHERLIIGDAYTLEVKRGGVTRSFGGNLLKASDKWIVLRRMASGRNDYGVPLLSSIPKVGSMFRRSYESLIEDDLWIPREAATIESHHKVVASTTEKPVVGNEPMVRTRCGVAFAHGDKFERRDGELTAVSDERVTVLTTGPFRAPYPQQIARGDILCVSIPVVISKVRMTQRDSSTERK